MRGYSNFNIAKWRYTHFDIGEKITVWKVAARVFAVIGVWLGFLVFWFIFPMFQWISAWIYIGLYELGHEVAIIIVFLFGCFVATGCTIGSYKEIFITHTWGQP